MDVAIQLLIYIFVVGYSCVIHECAHVWVAWKLGDPTGKSLGRLTLNPLPHVDFFWTILLPILTKVLGGFALGGPKPAPVNPQNFRNPRVGNVITAVAGPTSNLLLAAIGGGVLYALFKGAPDYVVQTYVRKDIGLLVYEPTFNAYFLSCVIFTNVSLAAFNMIPIPPLDGSRFLAFVFGERAENLFETLSRFAAIPLLILAWWLAPYALAPVITALYILLALIFPQEYATELLKAYFQRLF